MNDYQNSVIVALLPQTDYWCKIEPAHMTMVYVGEIENLKVSVYNELAKDAASIAMLSNPIMAKVMGIKEYGIGEDRVEALSISPIPEILSIREILQEWDNGEFPTFEPHATIGPIGSVIENAPMYLVFDRIAVFWGKSRLPFWLKKL